MIEIPFFPVELIFAGIWLLARAVVWLRRKRIDWKQETLFLLMFINLAVMIRFLFFPRGRVNGRVQPLIFDPATVFPFRINAVPFVHLFDYDSVGDILWNILGNTALFIPTGILLPIVYKNKLNRFWKVIAAGFGISLCFELLQLPFTVRASDIDDLILNTLGVMIGYGIYLAFRTLHRRIKAKKGSASHAAS